MKIDISKNAIEYIKENGGTSTIGFSKQG